ncbi:Cyclin, N-terminal domain containing protein [Tritrichomonas foetus]|uniref:Cyclin, N-terminal domain containing protein n=1 Tax=Tritrichomonas foetus TaxID=1144522 RepID=A0A1J4K4R8_9EUKA|nr:Cyclin, N-terminal domain containing protein [Tritrichomonas foetus]|eukprot:OHT04493.1 Cyclin, N-terminal domain containing protein [Tritrichomonas foetus]
MIVRYHLKRRITQKIVNVILMKTLSNHSTNFISPYAKKRPISPAGKRKHSENVVSSDYSDPEIYENDDSLLFPDEEEKFHPMEVQYQSLIYTNLLRKEPFFLADYLIKEKTCQRKIKTEHRTIVIDWLIRVCEEMKFLEDTLFVAVSLFDRVITIHQIKKCHIQLFGASCLWIASKLEETLTPALSDFVYLCGNTYIESEFIDCERVIVNILHFQIASTTPLFYVKSIIKDPLMLNFSNFFCRAMVFNEEYGNTCPSVIAASAVFLSAAIYGEFPKLETFKVDPVQVSDCAAKIALSVSEIAAKTTGALYDELQFLCDESDKTMKEIGEALVANVNAATIQHFCSI